MRKHCKYHDERDLLIRDLYTGNLFKWMRYNQEIQITEIVYPFELNISVRYYKDYTQPPKSESCKKSKKFPIYNFFLLNYSDWYAYAEIL